MSIMKALGNFVWRQKEKKEKQKIMVKEIQWHLLLFALVEVCWLEEI